jgi:hypothetical protein
MALLATGALYGLFIAFCIVPKVEASEYDLHTSLPSWISAPIALIYLAPDSLLDTIYLLSAILVTALVAALLPVLPEAVRRTASGVVDGLAWASSACAIYLLTVAAAGMIYANNALVGRDHLYASTLDHFSLLESANNKFDEVQAFLAKMNSVRLVEVNDASLLTMEQRGEQIRGLLYGMKATKDAVLLKQVLATSDEFRVDISKNTFDAKPVLESAALCGAPSDDINKFYDWLEPKLGTDGWNKIPLHVMVFDQ